MKIQDPTGTPLTPSDQGKDCLGNGERPEYECCCDECDYYLHCFPQCKLLYQKILFRDKNSSIMHQRKSTSFERPAK